MSKQQSPNHVIIPFLDSYKGQCTKKDEIIIVGKHQLQTFLGCWGQTPDVPGETYPE